MADLSRHADLIKSWNRDSQERFVTAYQEAQNNSWRPFYCPIATCDGQPHGEWAWQHGRVDQRPPPIDDPSWIVLFLSSGRGSGKTRTGSEIVHRIARRAPVRIGLIAPTGPDFRATMVEGVSGLMATADPRFQPVFEPSLKRLTWPNGTIAQGFSAEEPERLRGPQHHYVWADEPSHYPNLAYLWKQVEFGLRLGLAPKAICTSTPLPNAWTKEIQARPTTITRRVSSDANLHNLSPIYVTNVIDPLRGTRIGRQEIDGEVLPDVEGTLWNSGLFLRMDSVLCSLVRIVVSVDPAGSRNRRADDTGIVVIGLGEDGRFYVLADYTGKYSPKGWADRATSAATTWSADAIVAEKNYGGEMVKTTLEASAEKGSMPPRVILVESRRGKEIRAEPVVGLYERHEVVHVGAGLQKLEDEQLEWVPGQGDSPNRVDALVHGITELNKGSRKAEFADPSRLLIRHVPRPTLSGPATTYAPQFIPTIYLPR